jgi:hypothetical protein
MAAGNARLIVSLDAPAIGLAAVAWSGIATATATDWIGLSNMPGTVDASLLAWAYVSCSQSPNAARASGSCVYEQSGGRPPPGHLRAALARQ